MNLKDKTVIVTGAGSGIGAEIAIAFAKEGASVAVVGRNENNLKITVEKCAAIGKEALIIRADVSIEEDAKRIIQTTIDKFGKLDVLVNNAGITRAASICEGDLLGAYDAVMNTNLRAILHLTTLTAPHLAETKGNVVNISSSITETVTGSKMYTYSISKAALNHFTKLAAAELGPRGVRVNSVSPGPVRTNMFNHGGIPWEWDGFESHTVLNKIAEPAEIADIVIFLSSDKARSITGSNYILDNGFLLK